MSATNEMGALNTFGGNPHGDNSTKYHILRAIPMNLLLLGYETKSLYKTLNNNMEVLLQHH